MGEESLSRTARITQLWFTLNGRNAAGLHLLTL